MNHQRWTKEEEAWLEKNYKFVGLEYAMKELKRNEQSILHKVHRMGIIRHTNKQSGKIHVHRRRISLTDEGKKHFIEKKELETLFHRPLQTHEIINHNTISPYDETRSRRLQRLITKLREKAEIALDKNPK